MDALRKVSRKHNDKQNKKHKVSYDMIVMRTNRLGDGYGMSQLCEKCVLGVNDIQNKSGIKIKKIYYTTGNGCEVIKTTPNKMLQLEHQHITSYYRNHKYKSRLNES
jgi:hypothetical protein|tara:strand:- start:151 stop:471 length:321 start_codon:yes stop_codon:yes gene_type:complete